MRKFIPYLRVGIVIVLVLFFILAKQGTIPDVAAIPGERLPEVVKQLLVNEGIVSVEETIQYYYSEDLFSYKNYGNLFTDYRVISYELDEDEQRQVYSAEYKDIDKLVFDRDDPDRWDSTIKVYTKSGHAFTLVISNEDGGDKTFYDKLKDLWEKKK
jgi:hypothetical protein